MSTGTGFGTGALNLNQAMIAQITEGMDVVDTSGEHIGKVTDLRVGDPDGIDVGGGEARNASEGIAMAFGGHREPNVPQPLVGRILRQGYIKIDDKRHLRKDHHHYATAEQIASVDGKTVRLAVAVGDLIPSLDN